MLEGQSSLAEIQNKIASGKNFTSLAEDPVGASRVVNLKRELAQFDIFQSNIDGTKRRLELEETTLDALNNATTRAQELIIQASNGTLSDADRLAISYELEELVEYSASLMNTRDAKGEYIFSGSKGTTQTYVKNADGTYTYQGDDSRKQIQVGSNQYLESTDTGQDLFESVPGALSLSLIGGGNNPQLDGAFSNLEITDETAFSAFMQSTGDLKLSINEGTAGALYYSLTDSAGTPITNENTGTDLNLTSYTVSTPATSVTETIAVPGATFDLALPASAGVSEPSISLAGDGVDRLSTVSSPSTNPTLSNSQEFVDFYASTGPFRISVAVNPAATTVYDVSILGYNESTGLYDQDLTAALETAGSLTIGNTDPLTINLPGWNLSLDASESFEADIDVSLEPAQEVTLRLEQPLSNILSVLSNAVEAMRTNSITSASDRSALFGTLAGSLDSLAVIQGRYSQSIAGLGARLNAVDSAEFANGDFKLLTEATLSSVVDLDYASAATELSKRQLALEAAYSSFAKIQGLSLFNFIN